MPGPAASGVSFPAAPYEKLDSRPQTPQKPCAEEKDCFRLPSNLLRLKDTPILCFLQLADDFNRTMLRLKRTKIEPAAQPAGLPHRNIALTKNGSLRPMCYAADFGPSDFAWGNN